MAVAVKTAIVVKVLQVLLAAVAVVVKVLQTPIAVVEEEEDVVAITFSGVGNLTLNCY